jgi:type III pantothenate kinase
VASPGEAPAGTLLVDLGNTRTKWAWLDGHELHGFGALPWEAAAATDPPSAAMDAAADGPTASPALLLPLAPGRRPQRLLFSPMTRPAGNAQLVRWAREAWDLVAEPCPSESRRDGLVNGYAEPTRLGADRWWALVAAWRRHRRAVMVVDAGTALTLDGVDADGRHVVGYLQPGREVQLRALEAHTGVAAAAAPGHPPRSGGAGPAPGEPSDLHGRLDTHGCIDAALRLGQAALVEVAWCRFVQDRPQARLLLTGGGAEGLLGELPELPFEYCPHLVLDGLAARAEDA